MNAVCNIEFFHKGSKGESIKCGGGKTSELLCNKEDKHGYILLFTSLNQ